MSFPEWTLQHTLVRPHTSHSLSPQCTLVAFCPLIILSYECNKEQLCCGAGMWSDSSSHVKFRSRWRLCDGNLVLCQSQQVTDHIKTVCQSLTPGCAWSLGRARWQLYKCPKILKLSLQRDGELPGAPLALLGPRWLSLSYCWQRVAPVNPADLSKSPPFCGGVSEPWLTHTQTQGDRRTVSKQRGRG